MKICPVGAEMFPADGRTKWQADMTKLTIAFRSVVKAPKVETEGNFIKTWRDPRIIKK